MIRAFTSLISIFNNLDLTNFFPKQLTEPGGDSFTVMVATGTAQVAITQSANLQNLSHNAPINKNDAKKIN
jgi:hypothetical protein